MLPRDGDPAEDAATVDVEDDPSSVDDRYAPRDEPGNFDLDLELLAELSYQARFGRLSRFDLPPGKLPDSRMRHRLGAKRREDFSPLEDRSSDDVYPGHRLRHSYLALARDKAATYLSGRTSAPQKILSTALTTFPRIGDIFEGRYRLDQVVGQGGYARVYRAHQTDLGRDVAIKVLRPDGRNAAKAEESARRFQREAKLVSQLTDPHTLTVFDYGRAENGLLFMVTEFVEGENLLDFIHREGPLPPERAVPMIRGVLFSLEEAHDRGILHRDIKPANVMVYELRGRPDQVKLLDFGIAKAFDDPNGDADSMAVALTGKGRVVGSPGYMSPEQIRGDSLTPASDVYSVGLVFFEMLTGRRAIEEDDLRAAFRQIDEFPIELPEDVELPQGLRAAVERMVDKNIEGRFATAGEAIEALAPFGAPAPAPPAVRTTPEPSPSVASESDARSQRYLVLAIAALVVAVIAVVALWVVV